MGGDQAEAAQPRAWRVPRVNDSGVLNGACDLCTLAQSAGCLRSLHLCYASFAGVQAGLWSRNVDGLATARDGAPQMIDTLIVRVHQNGYATQYFCSQLARASRDVVTSG